MFSKLIAFGLAALTLVRAAPATGLDALIRSANHSADALTGGLERPYRIVNIARNSESVLMNGNVNDPVYVTREDPMYGEWYIEQVDDTYKISSKLTGHPIYVRDGILYSGNERPFVLFVIKPGMVQDIFQVDIMNEDSYWTVKDSHAVDTVVTLDQFGEPGQSWRFEPIFN
ncbi:hypothetical protein B0H13DRAFT_2327460 [Mycena leptocephala]|nr:hypothetical protein B0H13DRAFT_2327460 [Mycena leptocephala]